MPSIGKIPWRVVGPSLGCLHAHLTCPCCATISGDPVLPLQPRSSHIPSWLSFLPFFLLMFQQGQNLLIFCFLLTFKISFPFPSPLLSPIATFLSPQHTLPHQAVQVLFQGAPKCLNLTSVCRLSPHISVPHTASFLCLHNPDTAVYWGKSGGDSCVYGKCYSGHAPFQVESCSLFLIQQLVFKLPLVIRGKYVFFFNRKWSRMTMLHFTPSVEAQK